MDRCRHCESEQVNLTCIVSTRAGSLRGLDGGYEEMHIAEVTLSGHYIESVHCPAHVRAENTLGLQGVEQKPLALSIVTLLRRFRKEPRKAP